MLRYGPNEAPITWLDTLGEIFHFTSIEDTRLLIAGSVPIDVVEHAHDGDPVWKICRRGTSPQVRRVVGSLKNAIMKYQWRL